MSNLDQRIADLSPEKRALLMQRLQKERAEAGEKQAVPKRQNLASAPLSYAQQRLWFLEQLEPGAPIYNMPGGVRLSGILDVAALERSLNEIVRRHEALRTVFQAVDGKPVQVIAQELIISLPVVDLSGLSENEREAKVRRLAIEEAQRPFDLMRGPLLRASLLRLGEQEHVCLFTMHHIVSDGWSVGVFKQELAALYEAYSAGRPSPLPELPIQYADFACWQRQWQQGEILERQLAYWKQHLANAPPVLELPTDRPRPAVQTFRGAQHWFVLPSELADSLKTLSRQEGATLFMTLLAAFQTLLHRYTGQETINVATPTAGRNRAEIEGLIGFFLNTLVMSTPLSGELTFRELLGRVREVALGAFVHQDLPFEILVDELQLQRELSHTPLFQVMFILQNVPSESLELPGLTINPLQVHSGTAKLDLLLSLAETDTGLTGMLEYNTDLFDAATIERMADHFRTLLAGIVADPDSRLSELPILTKPEKRQILVEWNETDRDYPRQYNIAQLFEAQVAHEPEAAAFLCEDQELSYHELNQRANQVAHYLKSLGVGPEVLVGISVERSFEMAVGLLGIIKAGGAFLPLDPSYPKERLAFMLEDSQAAVLLTQAKFSDAFPANGLQVVHLDTDWEIIGQHATTSPKSETAPENLAYVIYTSGSTGKPKGVAVEQRQILNRLYWMWDAYPFEDGEVGCQKTALSFVDSIWELLGPLLQGVPTAIIPDQVLKDPHALVQALADYGVTRIWVVPTFLRAVLDIHSDLQVRLPKLTFWVASGEELSSELFQRFQERMPDSVLYNLYGTSEVWDVTWYDPTREGPPPWRVPIGRPITNMQVYILDSHHKAVPVGVTGELCVGGVGLARGYLNRPTLNAELFIPHPFDARVGARLYRSGDLARYLPDGNIEFVGRTDHQVKVRGYRIELGEIEVVLSQHPAVLRSIVVARVRDNDTRLVGYIVPRSQQTLSASDLRNFLREKLPDYMVPSAFVPLESLPKTPSGKINRRALPAPEWEQSVEMAGFVAPRTPTEEQVAAIWANLLGLERVGVHDSFFEVGGHSLLVIQFMAHLHQTFHVEASLRQFFETPTVAAVARAIDDLRRGEKRQQAASDLLVVAETDESSLPPVLVPIQPQGTNPALFCIHPAGGVVFPYYSLAPYLGTEQPLYGVQDPSFDGMREPYTRVEDMAAHYVEALQIVQPEGAYHLLGWSFGGTVAFEVSQQLHRQGREVALLAMIDTEAPVSGRTIPRSLSSSLKSLSNRLGMYLSAAGDSLPYLRDAAYLLASTAMRRRDRTTEKPGLVEYLRWAWTAALRSYFLKQADMAQVVPEDSHLLDVRLPTVRRVLQLVSVHQQLSRKYIPQVYPGRITLFRASQQSSWTQSYQEPSLGWDELATQGVDVYTIPGNHIVLLSEPYIGTFAQQLQVCLERAQTSLKNDHHSDF